MLQIWLLLRYSEYFNLTLPKDYHFIHCKCNVNHFGYKQASPPGIIPLWVWNTLQCTGEAFRTAGILRCGQGQAGPSHFNFEHFMLHFVEWTCFAPSGWSTVVWNLISLDISLNSDALYWHEPYKEENSCFHVLLSSIAGCKTTPRPPCQVALTWCSSVMIAASDVPHGGLGGASSMYVPSHNG